MHLSFHINIFSWTTIINNDYSKWIKEIKNRKHSILTTDVISKLCREEETKCDNLHMQTILPPYARDAIEHCFKIFHISSYDTSIRFISLTSFVIFKDRVEMNEIRFK